MSEVPSDDWLLAADIMETTAAEAGFTVADLIGPRRTKGLVHTRHLAMSAIRRTTALSFPQIGLLFDRHHSTVIHACQKELTL